MQRILVTGSAGLVGSEVSRVFASAGWEVHGFDNNGRAAFFGHAGDTSWNGARLLDNLEHFHRHDVDVRDRPAVDELVGRVAPDAIVHAAAQPSHDLAKSIPFDDFETNAVGTLNMLEAARRHASHAPFVFMSTNKVYGDTPNGLPLVELESRFDYAEEERRSGIREDMSVDRSAHSLFGVSKLAGDLLVQEYVGIHGLTACCIRAGCITGPDHAGVELHGFLSYLVRCNVTGERYTIYGYKGKQVRDNIHAHDLARFIRAFVEQPRAGEIYNLGGGRENSCSILEAFGMVEQVSGVSMNYDYEDRPRYGDHICYISDLAHARDHYPDWNVTHGLESIVEEIHRSWLDRLR